MKKINRREFLKNSSAAMAAMGLAPYWIPKSAQANGTGTKKVVMFFLNGGNDGQNTIVPTTTYDSDDNEVADFAGDWLGEWDPDGDPDDVPPPTLPIKPPFTGPNSHSQYDHYRALRRDIHLVKSDTPLVGEDGQPYLHPESNAQIINEQMLPLTNFDGGATTKHQLPMTGSISQGTVEFSLHPAMQSLVDIWNAGHLAVFPATHCGPNSNRSHFFQTEYFGNGLYQNSQGQTTKGDGRGWVGRYFEQKYLPVDPNRIEGFDFESGYFPLMNGEIPILAVDNPLGVLSSNENDLLSDVLGLNAAKAADSDSLEGKYATTQKALFDKVQKLMDVPFPNSVNDFNDSNPGSDADYPNTSTGRKFMQTAAMIKDVNIGPEIEVFNIDRGSFDTHGGQTGDRDRVRIDGNNVDVDPERINTSKGGHANILGEVADCIKAFYDDLNTAGCGDDVVTVVLSEFGRTADENGNKGTDHARATCWFVAGNNVNGGLYGEWPGTANNVPDLTPGNEGDFVTDLDGGSRKYLYETVDYRDILSEIIDRHLNSPGAVDAAVPFNPTGPLATTDPYTLPVTPLGFIPIV